MFASPLVQAVLEFNQLNEDQIEQLKNPPQLTLSQHPSFIAAAQLIHQAIQNQNKIVIYGDYDVDGICSTSILYLTLKRLNAKVSYYLPHRFNDGYGISVNFVKQALTKEMDLFIVVDNGVTALEALSMIRQAGKQSLVIDHHSFVDDVPCDVLIHAQELETSHVSLCSSGLAQQLSHHLSPFEPYYVTLAGIATLADMMPVWGYNRAVIQYALKTLNEGHYPHLRALLSDGHVNEESIAYQLVPKMNAVGRLANELDINLLVKYLSFNDLSLKQQVLSSLVDINQKRKTLQNFVQQKALELMQPDPILCVADEEFHEGVVGITAGYLARQFKRPAIVLHRNPQRLKGSARSYGSINLLATLQPLKPFIERIGGHAAALGLEIKVDHYEHFLSALKTIELNYEEPTSGSIRVLESSWLNLENFEFLDQCRPFGQGFEMPLFELREFVIKHIDPIKGGYRLHLIWNQHSLTALTFNPTLELESIFHTQRCFVRISVDTFKQRKSLKIVVEDFA